MFSMSKNYIVFDSMMVPPQKNIFLLLYCIIFDNKFLLILRNSKLLSINFLCVTLSHMSIGLSNITKVRKRPMVVISGILGTVTAVWLYNNFVGWLNILNCTLPPVGMIVVLGYFCHKEEYEKWDVIPRQVNWFAIAGVLIGAAVANLVPWGIASVNGMVIAAVCYLVGELVERKKK